MPRVGHVKAIDVFLLGSFLFVFAALVEYAIICSFSNEFSSTTVETSNHKLSKGRPCLITEEVCDDKINHKENGTLHLVFETKQEKIQVDVFLLTLLILKCFKTFEIRDTCMSQLNAHKPGL